MIFLLCEREIRFGGYFRAWEVLSCSLQIAILDAGRESRAPNEAELKRVTRLYSYVPCTVPKPYARGQLDLTLLTTG